MKKVYSGLLLSLFLISNCFICHFSYPADVRIITEDWPPQNYMEMGKLKGPSVDIVKNIQKKVGSKSKIEVLPWKRGYKIVSEEKDVALFSVTRNEKRESLFKWVGPLLSKSYGFFTKKDSKIAFSKLEDAVNYRVGAQKGGITEEFLKTNNFKNIQGVQKSESNIGKLDKGRIDLWYESNATMVISTKKMKVNPEDYKMVYTTKKSSLYIAFSKKTSDDIVEKWQSAFDELYNSGEIKKIFEKHKNASLYPEK